VLWHRVQSLPEIYILVGGAKLHVSFGFPEGDTAMGHYGRTLAELTRSWLLLALLLPAAAVCSTYVKG